jgi:hypothetical protein
MPTSPCGLQDLLAHLWWSHGTLEESRSASSSSITGPSPSAEGEVAGHIRARSAAPMSPASWPSWATRTAAVGGWLPAFASSLAYDDGFRRERGPANLLQAQRDFFGAHTYRRIDRPGTFHTRWSEDGQEVDP